MIIVTSKNKFLLFFIFILISGPTYLNSMEQERKKGFAELMSAARFLTSFEQGQRLIKCNDVNQKNEYGQTALMVAASRRNPIMVQSLIANKANINRQDENGETVLMKAAKIDSMEIVMLFLVEPEIKLGLKDRLGRTALDFAKSKPNKTKTFNVAGLLSEGEALEKVIRRSGDNVVLKDRTERKEYFQSILREALKV